MKEVRIVKNRYVDSVTLMSVAGNAMQLPGVINAEAGMATPANINMLTGMGYRVAPDAAKNDLMLAVSADTSDQAEAAFQSMKDELAHGGRPGSKKAYQALTDIDLKADPFDLVQISLPGEYAAAQARKAIEMGLDVFIFSDNVSLREELALKRLGRERNRLVMGPDCGVGLINGVALAAGSIIKPGAIGIVGASGSGAQEVGCLIERMGQGVCALIGTGGRDLSPGIGGITMKMGIEKLGRDPACRVIVLVSKLADEKVMKEVLAYADGVKKPVVAVFLGGGAGIFAGHRTLGALSLEEAAQKAVEALTGLRPAFGASDEEIARIVRDEMKKIGVRQKYFRGLYCGGTFTEEALIYFSRHNACQLNSNLKTRYAAKIPDPEASVGHTILDLGSEEFTEKAPHPVFDPAIRLKRFRKEMEDEALAVVLLDFITGPGVHPDPATAFVKAYREGLAKRGDHVTCIATVCGSKGDPQDVEGIRNLLKENGVLVMDSNYQSARLASAMMAALEGRG